MSEDQTFTQAQLDQIVRDRVQAKDQEIERLQGQLATHKQRIRSMEARDATQRVNIRESARERAIRMAALDGVEVGEDGTLDAGALEGALRSVLEEIPELAAPAPPAVQVGGGSNPAGGGASVPLTRDEIKGMSPEQINSRWDQVKRVLSGG